MSIRILPVFISFLLMNMNSFSQIVTESVDFDNYVSPTDNDLTHRFNGLPGGFTQIPGNGITGGCLLPPDSNIWGNDNSRYCSKFKAVVDTSFSGSLCFKYDPSLINSGFDRAASIWIQPHADPNHYIIATLSHDARIQIYTYFSFTQSQAVALQSGNWYKLNFDFHFTSTPNLYSTVHKTKIEDLGPSGTGIPVALDSVVDFVQDSILFHDDAIEVSITGARYGGVEYVDNFRFAGIKSADSCLTTGISADDYFASEIKIITERNILKIEGSNLSDQEINIVDLNGRVILHSRLSSDKNAIDISNMNSGIYFLVLNDSVHRLVRKLMIEN